MSKTLSEYVHVFHDGALVTLAPGDTLPDWAEDRVTNPAVFSTVKSTDSNAAPTESKPIAERSGSELKALAAELGISKSGNKEALVERIEAHIAAATVEAVATTAAAGDNDGNADDAGGSDAGADGLAALQEKAVELGIEVSPEMTEAELEALIEQKQE